ncbi:MAG: hypothetical protein HY537_15530 [Deltaproteobacteria bacterium]|nr:hypothetical protein [Deltaproteobacteria bacterium]
MSLALVVSRPCPAVENSSSFIMSCLRSVLLMGMFGFSLTASGARAGASHDSSKTFHRPQDYRSLGVTKTEPVSSCSFEFIAQYNPGKHMCELFPPSQETIHFPDGSMMHNLSFDRSKSKEDGSTDLDYFQYGLDRHTAIKEFLDSKLSGKLSPDFRLALSAHRGDVVRDILLPIIDPSAHSGKEFFVLPWPADQQNAAPKKVSWEELNALLRPLLLSHKKEIEDLSAKWPIDKPHLSAREPVPQMADKTKPIDQERLESLVQRTKRSITLLVTGGRDRTHWSEPEKRLVAKIDSVHVTAMSSLVSHEACSGTLPNAFYSPASHSINICPKFMDFPEATLVAVIGHEMGHSIDPCGSQCSVYNVDLERLEKAEGRKPDSRDDPEIASLVKFLSIESKQQEKGKSFRFALPTELMFGKDALTQAVSPEEFGLLHLASAGVSPVEYPLEEVMKCLNSARGGDFRRQTDKEQRQIAGNIAKEIVRETGGDVNRIAERIFDRFRSHPECTFFGKASRLGEAMADWIGAEAMGDYLLERQREGNGMNAPMARLETIAFFANIICAENSKAQKPSEKKAVEALFKTYARLSDPHPASLSRVDNVFLRNSKVRKALGCSPDDRECHRNG